MLLRRLSIKEAKEQGFSIDTACYPHCGFKGPRFSPYQIVFVRTNDETLLIEELKRVRSALLMDDSEHPWIPGIRAKQVLAEIRTTLIAVGEEKP